MSAPLRFVTAVHRYDAASATQVSFVPGERLAVLAQIDEHWYSGESASGQRGLFPVAYVRDEPQQPQQPLQPALHAQPITALQPRQAVQFSINMPTQPSQPQTQQYAAQPYAAVTAPQPLSVPVDTRLADYRRRLVPSPTVEPPYDVEIPTSPSPPPSPPPFAPNVPPQRVFIFDMDETLVVFNELLNGKFAAAHPNLDAKLCEQVAQGLESAIFHICDHHFFFRALEELPLVHIDDLAGSDDGIDLSALNLAADPGVQATIPVQRLTAYRCRQIRQRYEQARTVLRGTQFTPTHIATAAYVKSGADSMSLSKDEELALTGQESGGWCMARKRTGEAGWVPASYLAPAPAAAPLKPPARRDELGLLVKIGLLSDEQADGLALCHRDLRNLTSRWLDIATRLLQAVWSQPNTRVVLVTNAQLIPALAKLLVFRLTRFFGAADVYSSAHAERKLQCFRRIQARFPGASFTVIGDGNEEEQVSAALNMTFAKCRSLSDLKRLCRHYERCEGAFRPK